LLVVFFYFQSSFSQNNYLPGYIINKKGETIKGLIDYKNWEKNPDAIFFKTNIENKRKEYSPNDIAEFMVQDEIYISAVVNIEVSPIHTNDLQYDSSFQYKKVTTFLQAKVLGEKSLYYLNNGKDNFYIKNDEDFMILKYKKYLRKQNDKNLIIEMENYIGQLSHYLGDCSSINSKFKNINYTRTSLEKLFLFYYDCVNSKIKYHKKTEKITVKLGLIAGLSITSLNFESESTDAFRYLTEVNYDKSKYFTAGLFVDVILPRNHKRWSLYNELLYTTYNFKGQYDDIIDENRYKIYNTEIGYTYLKINNMLRYTYPIKGLFIYINAGISNGLLIKEVNDVTRQSKFFTSEEVRMWDAVVDTRVYEQGLLIGSGIKLKQYSFEIRYERGNGMSELLALKSTTDRIYFMFGYRF